MITVKYNFNTNGTGTEEGKLEDKPDIKGKGNKVFHVVQ